VSDAEVDLSATFHFLFVNVQAYLDEMRSKRKKKSFEEQVKKKRGLYHLAPVIGHKERRGVIMARTKRVSTVQPVLLAWLSSCEIRRLPSDGL